VIESSDQEDDVDQLGKYMGYLGDMFALVNWTSPWTWLVIVALLMALKAANN
jgi:hypothetical protein